MNLVIDKGNTLSKVAIFDQGKIVKRYDFTVLNLVDTKKILTLFPSIKHVLISSVTDFPQRVESYLLRRCFLLNLNQKTKLPFINRYKSPTTIGTDRLAAVAGAVEEFKKKNILILDAGTCIKFNFIKAKNEFIGGSISPGLEMRFRSLHNFTGKLPLINKRNSFGKLIGTTTEESILSGVLIGTLYEVNGIIAEYKKKYSDLAIVVTGGDTSFFENNLKMSIFARPHLILQGLNYILDHNVIN